MEESVGNIKISSTEASYVEQRFIVAHTICFVRCQCLSWQGRHKIQMVNEKINQQDFLTWTWIQLPASVVAIVKDFITVMRHNLSILLFSSFSLQTLTSDLNNISNCQCLTISQLKKNDQFSHSGNKLSGFR